MTKNAVRCNGSANQISSVPPCIMKNARLATNAGTSFTADPIDRIGDGANAMTNESR